jgi:ABC-type Na+ transport system ATPase subunit NatA
MLEARGLRKAFGGVVAVDGVSLAIERGRVLALPGPSGAGKTTTVSMLAGLVRAESGQVGLGAHVRVSGVAAAAHRRRAGALAVDGLDAMTSRGLGSGAALTPAAVLLGFAALFGTLAVARFRWEESPSTTPGGQP